MSRSVNCACERRKLSSKLFYHSITKFVLHNCCFFFFCEYLVFDCLESDLPSFNNTIPSGPVCHALRNREIAFLTNGRAGSGYE